MRIIFFLLLLLAPAGAQAQSQASACDRECLRGRVTDVLHALVTHEIAGLPVAGDLRVTEDGAEKPLGQVELLRSMTKLRGYRQDIIDVHAGEAVAGVMVEERGAPVILVVRVKVDEDTRIEELELVSTRGRADGMLFNVDTYGGAPAHAMNVAPAPDRLESRDDAVAIAMHYPRGLSNAETFNAVGTPFSPDAYRLENGMLMAGPGCSFIPGCGDIGNQSLGVFNMLGRVTIRDILVDERMGIVLMRLSWNAAGGPDSDKLTAWEMFKVYDGQIHMVEAYIRLMSPEQELGGWPIAEGITQP